MLLVLAERIRDELPLVLRTQDLRDALLNLARAHHEGKHILSGPFRVLAALATATELPEDVRGTFRQIKLRHHELGSLRASMTHIVEIEPREGAILEDGDHARQCYRVPLAYFSDSARVQKSRLVAEDRDDARIYEHAAQAYLSRFSLKGIRVRLQTYGGGGSSIADALRDHAREGPTVCIVDADRRWSSEEGTAQEGRTAVGAREVARDLAGKAVAWVYVPPCREIENLLPASIVLESFVATDKGDFHARCKQIERLGFFGGGLCVDIKEGLRRWDFERLGENDPERRYLARTFAEHLARVPSPPGGFCEDAPECRPREPRERCRCVLFEGAGTGLLARIADELDKRSPQKVAEHLFASDRAHAPEWTAIGRLLFSWGCSYSKTRG
jgi:hypothetical protein